MIDRPQRPRKHGQLYRLAAAHPNAAGSLHVGCCGWVLSQAEYFRNFSVMEVQQTFYQPPRLETLAKWREGAPREFEFTLKAWQLITHEPTSPTYQRLKIAIPQRTKARYGAFRPTEEVQCAWRTTLDCARALDARIILFQCPASFTPSDEHIENLRDFFAAARRDANDLVLAWEPRGKWTDRVVQALCTELHIIHAVDPFVQQPVTLRPRYFRLHGIGGYNYSYSDVDFDRLAGWCRGETYVMFNNKSMAQDALRFRTRYG
jgi:uncharacterized protein YecE (DUF72 family)